MTLDLALDERPCDACDKMPASHIRFHEKYPNHVYSLCEDHDSDETVNRLVAQYEEYMANKDNRFSFKEFTEPEARTFKSICHEMHQCFGGAFNNLEVLAKTGPELELLKAQMSELKQKMRELLEQAKELKE